MRANTMVWLAARQVGVPDSESKEHVTVKEAIKKIATILAQTGLRGSRFEFQIATDESKLKDLASEPGLPTAFLDELFANEESEQ